MWSVPSRARLSSQCAVDVRLAAAVLALGRAHPDLGGDHRLVAPAAERPTEELLGLALAVDVGGVEVVDAGVERGVDHVLRRGLVDPHPEVVAAEAGDRHLEAAHPAQSPSCHLVVVRDVAAASPRYRRSVVGSLGAPATTERRWTRSARRTAASGCGSSELVAGADDAALDTIAPATPDWTVHDLLAHLVGVTADIVSGNLDGVGTDAWTAAQVEARRDRQRRRAARRVERARPRGRGDGRAVRSRPPASWCPTPPPTSTTCGGALGAPGARDSDAVVLSFGFVGCHARRAARRRRIAARSVVHHGDDDRHFGTGEPVASLRIDDFEFVRALTGRRSVEQIAALRLGRRRSRPIMLVLARFVVARPDAARASRRVPSAAVDLSRSFAPFRHRRFALLWAGAFVSNIGTWMETVGVGILVTSATGQGRAGPAWSPPPGSSRRRCSRPLGGALADRVPRRTLLLVDHVVPDPLRGAAHRS